MHVSGIDHINILTDDLDRTAQFYARLMGLTQTENPAISLGFKGAWMRDAHGNAIIHLVWKDPQMDRYEGYAPGASTNAVHHVAFKCAGFDEMIGKLEEMGLEYRVNDLQHLGVRQIMVTDPNAVNLELNFVAD
ncbi:VOC family protein [Novosphingobium mangrovi (ex Huang et al. 2023)]|uniref:VOC family protein n=1 Tax=Novosphingobium mangrovi (ex Huang et al. 2023) TaxID=2976432 RepID=A0ABT2I8H5_9SPHN|nr:VOC family protein [Novosphingobium mangrovi (ex Huang et al. 2023)]MCT2401120.1 VOC family protein [Novosphingobium mangrovi (ex Huang et al. 2023)]